MYQISTYLDSSTIFQFHGTLRTQQLHSIQTFTKLPFSLMKHDMIDWFYCYYATHSIRIFLLQQYNWFSYWINYKAFCSKLKDGDKHFKTLLRECVQTIDMTSINIVMVEMKKKHLITTMKIFMMIEWIHGQITALKI